MGFRCRKPATKPLLNLMQKLKRLQWANVHKDAQKWSKVIFSDQFKLCIKFGDREALIWRTKDEHYNPVGLKRSMKFPTSVMVWSVYEQEVWAILSSSNQQLHIHHTMYMEMLESPCFIHKGSVWHLYGDEDMIFSKIWLLHTPHAPAHKKGQDMATEVKHSSALLASQQSRPKYY